MQNLPLADCGGFPAGNSSSCERFPSPWIGDPARLAPTLCQKDRHSGIQEYTHRTIG